MIFLLCSVITALHLRGSPGVTEKLDGNSLQSLQTELETAFSSFKTPADFTHATSVLQASQAAAAVADKANSFDDVVNSKKALDGVLEMVFRLGRFALDLREARLMSEQQKASMHLEEIVESLAKAHRTLAEVAFKINPVVASSYQGVLKGMLDIRRLEETSLKEQKSELTAALDSNRLSDLPNEQVLGASQKAVDVASTNSVIPLSRSRP